MTKLKWKVYHFNWEIILSKRIEKRRDELLGKEFETLCGRCFIIDYKGSKDVTVMFYEPTYATKCRLSHLKDGLVYNPLKPCLYGVGFTGIGKYSAKKDGRAYSIWSTMLKRSYDQDLQETNPTYAGVTVCDEWHNFQNFAKWYYENPFSRLVDNYDRSYHLDKDILVKGNKVYSPKMCCFIPQELNKLILNRSNDRGDLPVGVTLFKRDNKYTAHMSVGGRPKNLGYFHKAEEAFNCYKQAKECHIKSLAEKWKGKIDDKVYQALLEWKIQITD